MSKVKLPFRPHPNDDDPAAMNDEASATAAANMKKYEPMKSRAYGKYEPYQKATVIKDLNDMPEVAARAVLAEGAQSKKRRGALRVQGAKRAKKIAEGGGGGAEGSDEGDDEDE